MRVQFRTAWQASEHSKAFDVWSKLTLGELKKTFESFNEIRLFNNYAMASVSESKTFVEIGCATGELYRYLHHFHPEYDYFGFDILIHDDNKI